MATSHVIRRGALALTAIALLPIGAAAQTVDPANTVDELKAPPAPAMVVLGLAPTTIDRPQSVRAIVASIVAASKDAGGFPRNYSVELSPYWLAPPELSFDEYYRNSARNLYRHFSVSVAMTPLGEGGTGTAIGIGARTLVLAGRPHPRLNELRLDLAKKQAALHRRLEFQSPDQDLITLLAAGKGAAMDAMMAELGGASFTALRSEMNRLQIEAEKLSIELDFLEPEKKAEAEKLEKALSAVRAQQSQLGAKMMTAVQQSKAGEFLSTSAVLQALSARLEPSHTAAVETANAAVTKAALAIQDLDQQRVGPLLAVAYASAIEIPGNRTSDIRLGRSGFWLTPGYRFLVCGPSGAKTECTASVEVLGVARYLTNVATDASLEPDESTWEFGTRVVWQPFVPFATSLEWLGRTETDEDTGTRLVAVAEYRFTQTAHLYASFGRDFSETGNRRNLVSMFGITLGFGRQPILKPAIERTGTTKLPIPFPIK
jgi:hypothetical protein